MTPKSDPPENPSSPQDAEQLASELDAILQAELPHKDVSPDERKTPYILVVDDDQDCRSLLKDLLENSLYRVLEACDGVEGLKYIHEHSPDLVIMDFNMPRMNGYELMREIKSVMEIRKIPILIFTGSRNRRNMQEITLDAVDFLEKPASCARILEAISKALEGAGHPSSSPKAALEIRTKTTHIFTIPAGKQAADNSSEPKKSEAAPPQVQPPVRDTSVDLGPMEEALLEVIASDEKNQAESSDEHGLEGLADDSPLIAKINQILVKAVRLQASDIHIEPQEDGVKVRVRLDGSLRLLCTLPIALQPRVAARIKVMSHLLITERRLPQDGRFRVQIDGAKTEFRVSTVPSANGEKIVLRILGQSKLTGDLAQMQLNPRNLQCVERSLKSHHGIILVTGPTGSGKTTTLYTMISALNQPDVNIVTAEDPVEYRLPGITQVQTKPGIGLTFESILRAFLRQDPDVILVGEIRDKETAEIAMRAALTGHLVLSTLHTNSAPATISRLTQMGLPSYLITASVKMVIAQRLMKVLCPLCKIPVSLADEDRRILTETEISALKTMYRAVGCDGCHQTGYLGRKAIFEVMPVASSRMRNLILTSQSVDDLTELAQKEGMTTLRQAAIETVGDGSTSLQEAMKIILAD